jgi:hypothetical protein
MNSFLSGVLDDCSNSEDDFFESLIGDSSKTTHESSAVKRAQL